MAAVIGAIAVTLLVLDFLWLRFVIGDTFRSTLGDVALTKLRWAPIVLFYLGYVAAIAYFAVLPAANGGGMRTALVSGALLGAVAYGTYDLTNMATLKPWTWQLVAMDVAWGAFLTAISAVAGFAAWQALDSR